MRPPSGAASPRVDWRFVSGVRACVVLAVCVGLAACVRVVPPSEETIAEREAERQERAERLIFGRGGVFGSDSGADGPPAPTMGNVNPFLWRASLSTVSFMPLASADSEGGVIVTEWYSPPEAPNERFKINVFITALDLRSDALEVSVFRERRVDGEWVTAEVNPDTRRDIENRILTHARRLRLEAQEASSR